MPLTRWSFFWGGPIPDDPTFWGGNVPVIPPITDPTAIESRISFSALWMAEDRAAATPSFPPEVRAGDTMGWVPALSGVFQKGGDITFVIFHDPVAVTQTFNIVRADGEGSTEVLSDSAEVIEQCHAEPFTAVVTTGTSDDDPSFTCFAEDLGDSHLITWNFILRDLSAAPNKVDPAWDNELGVALSEMRMVSLPNNGTIIVIPLNDELYLKPLFGSGTSTPAVKLNFSLKPSAEWTLKLDRLHVVCTGNGVLIFYYGAVNPSGNLATLVTAYTPHHALFSSDLPYSANGIVHRPTVFVNGELPTISDKGAMRHSVSNDLLIALQLVSDTFQVESPNISWYTTRGLGILPDPAADEWNASTHPNLFGGELENACPTRDISLVSVNWIGGRQSSGFQVISRMSLNAALPSFSVVDNTYKIDTTPSQASVQRMLLGNVYVTTADEANTGGKHTTELVRTVAMHTLESKRQGYNLVHDILKANIVARLNEEGAGGNIELEVGVGVATGDGSLVPVVGMIGTSLSFPLSTSTITIPADPSYTGASVTISLWAYPLDSAQPTPADKFTLVYREGLTTSSLEASYRIYWKPVLAGTNGVFGFQTKNISGFDTAEMVQELPPERWYHITVVYDDVNGFAEIYLFGIRVARAVTGAAEPLDIDPTAPIYLGMPAGHATYTAFPGRIDDFVFANRFTTHQQLVTAFFDSMVAADGPVRCSRSNDLQFQDHIFSTASIMPTSSKLEVMTVAARYCNFHVGVNTPFHRHVVFDVWKLERANNSEPKYMGILAPPAIAMDRFSSDALTTGVSTSPDPISAPLDGSTPAIDFDIKLVSDPATGKLRLYMLFQNDKEGSGTDKSTIYRVTFDPGAPILASQDTTAYDWVLETGPTKIPTAWTVVPRTTDSKNVVVVSVLDRTTKSDSEIWVQHEDRFNGVDIPNKKQITDILPIAASSFFAYDYTTAFSTSGRGATPRGMIGRELVMASGQGWPDGTDGDIQLIFGVVSAEGGTEIPAEAPQEQLIGTLIFIIPSASVTVAQTDDFAIHPDLRAMQLDEYGVGGIDPFIPIGYANHPVNSAGNGMFLGLSGTRDTTNPGLEGQGGLKIYTTKREWNWGIRPIFCPGPQWSHAQSNSSGASMAVEQRNSLDPNEPTGFVWVARPLFDRTDRFSVIYMSQSEGVDAGYDTPSNPDNPVYRRSDRNSGVVWVAHSFDMPAWTERGTGSVVKQGVKRKVMMTLRWSSPGKVYDLDIPNP